MSYAAYDVGKSPVNAHEATMPPPGRLAVHNVIDARKRTFIPLSSIPSSVWSDSGGRRALRYDALALMQAARMRCGRGSSKEGLNPQSVNGHDRRPRRAVRHRLRMSRCGRWTMSIDKQRVAAIGALRLRVYTRPRLVPANQQQTGLLAGLCPTSPRKPTRYTRFSLSAQTS
jgi:hypothetical protein